MDEKEDTVINVDHEKEFGVPVQNENATNIHESNVSDTFLQLQEDIH
jgi:hypothetical protein